MQTCPKCGYALTAFDTICPRCKGEEQTAPRPAMAYPSAPKRVLPPPPAAPATKSHSSAVVVSIVMVICGGWLGLKFGSAIGDFFDGRSLELAGHTRATKPNYFYWSIRMGVIGTFLGWIAGAICGYIYDKRNP